MDTINKIRSARFAKAIDAAVTGHFSGGGERGAIKSAIMGHFSAMHMIGNDSNESQEVTDMIDMLSAYWKLATKRFIDNVCADVDEALTASERYDELDIRLQETFVFADDAGTKLQGLFREDPLRRTRRERLKTQVSELRKAQQRMRLGVQ
jgi:interferon-induced GTP-binding protein Mx1